MTTTYLVNPTYVNIVSKVNSTLMLYWVMLLTNLVHRCSHHTLVARMDSLANKNIGILFNPIHECVWNVLSES